MTRSAVSAARRSLPGFPTAAGIKRRAAPGWRPNQVKVTGRSDFSRTYQSAMRAAMGVVSNGNSRCACEVGRDVAAYITVRRAANS